MLSNILTSIEALIRKQFEIDDSTVEKLIEVLRTYNAGMWIYPGVIKRKAGMSISESYSLLQVLEKEGVVQGYYELYCGHCQKSNGIVHLFNMLPETFECELCGFEIPTVENTVLIYKVVKDE